MKFNLNLDAAKHERDVNTKVDKIMQERKENHNLGLHIMHDNMTKYSERKVAQSKFKSLNSYLNSQRTERDQVETEERVNADISYFPFTHGEVIEKQRKEHTETQKNELQTIFNEMLA